MEGLVEGTSSLIFVTVLSVVTVPLAFLEYLKFMMPWMGIWLVIQLAVFAIEVL